MTPPPLPFRMEIFFWFEWCAYVCVAHEHSRVISFRILFAVDYCFCRSLISLSLFFFCFRYYYEKDPKVSLTPNIWKYSWNWNAIKVCVRAWCKPKSVLSIASIEFVVFVLLMTECVNDNGLAIPSRFDNLFLFGGSLHFGLEKILRIHTHANVLLQCMRVIAGEQKSNDSEHVNSIKMSVSKFGDNHRNFERDQPVFSIHSTCSSCTIIEYH